MFTPHLLVLGLVTALLSSAIPYSLEMVALKRIAAGRSGILMSIEPVIGALIGGILLNEYLTLTQWVAICLIVMASSASILTSADGEKYSA